jgi:hypothetical protein
VPLTHRGLATGVRYVTGHRAKDGALDLDWASLASADTTLVVYMGVANIADIAARLMAHGLPADCRCWPSPQPPPRAKPGCCRPVGHCRTAMWPMPSPKPRSCS